MPISFSAITITTKVRYLTNSCRFSSCIPTSKKNQSICSTHRDVCVLACFFLRNRHFDHLGFPTFARCWRHSNKLRKLWMLRPLPRQCLGWKDLEFEIEWGNKRMRWRSDRVNGSASKCHWIHKFRGYSSLSLLMNLFVLIFASITGRQTKKHRTQQLDKHCFQWWALYSMMFWEAKECTLLRKYVAQLSRGG